MADTRSPAPPMQEYYAKRAGEYERIYDKPERQGELAWLRERIPAIFRGRSVLEVTLSEGRNRIVRRWVEEMGGKVERLARVSYGPVRLDDLPSGHWRPLTPQEERGIYKAIGMKEEEA